MIDRTHPEGTCDRCGGPNVCWFTDNDLFNRVNGSPNGVLCPVCFVVLADAAGVPNTGWKLTPETLGDPS